MPVNVLVATPHAAFGSLLKISLLDSGSYQIKIAQSAQAAREFFTAPDSPLFDLAIFDSALSDEPFVPLCHDLLEQQPGVRLIVIPPENNPNHPSLGGLMPHAYLNRPFYLPDLLDTVQRLLVGDQQAQVGQNKTKEPSSAEPQTTADDTAGAGEVEKQPAPASAPVPSTPLWLRDAGVLRDYLAEELAKTRALSALVGVYGPEPGQARLIAQAGSLSEEYVQALAEVTFRYWNDQEKTDLMRYIRIPQDRNDFLVYATRITGGRVMADHLVLVLVHDNITPVSLIRPQTRAIAQALASLPPENFTLTGSQPTGQAPDVKKDEVLPASRDQHTQPLIDTKTADQAQDELPEPNEQPPYAWLSYGEAPSDKEPLPQDKGPSNGDQGLPPGIDLSAILGAIPSPNPGSDSLPGRGWPLDRFSGRETPTIPGGGFSTGEPGDWLRTPPQTSNEPESQPDKRFTEPLDPSRLSSEPLKQEKGREIEGPTDWLKSLDSTTPTGQDDQETHETISEPQTIVDPPDLFDLPDLYETQDLADLKDQASQNEEEAPEEEAKIEATRPVEPLGRRSEGATSSRRISAAMDVKTEPPITPAAIAPSMDANAFPAEPPAGPEDTQPTVVSTLTRLDQLEPISPAISLLKYTCVILPRLPQHYLTGELAEKLSLWLPQACLAYGWRLEGIAIRPEYLQWTVQVVPAISPGNLVRTLRQRISFQIFNAFPHLAEQNPSGDFWAMGYLIVSGGQPPSAQLLRDYIAQTRKRQGVVRS